MPQAILSKYLLPDVLNKVGHHDFVPRQLVEGTMAGQHKSPFHGFAVEFAGHREYVPGDDLRHLDWNVYFRRDKFFIKQYEMETNLVCHLLLDVSASMRYGEGDQQKLLYASRMALTLAYLIVQQADKVSATLFDEEVREVLPPSNGLPQVFRMTDTLDRAKPVKKTKMGPALLDLAGRAGRRGIVIIFSDFLADLDDLEQALQHLRYHRHEIVLMQVMHHDELTFDLPGLVRFIGLEDPGELLTRPEDVKATYLEALRRFNHRLQEVCEANHVERVLCDTSRDMGEIFADYLQKRMMIHKRW
jgi:uncharacterized protein (DUF58 family)